MMLALGTACGGAATGPQLTAIAASSGPRPSVAVTFLDPIEVEAPDVPLRWIRMYEASDKGLRPLGEVRADQVVGVSGGKAPTSVAPFHAHASDDSSGVIEGLVADDLSARSRG